MDEVSRQQTWTETIRREMRACEKEREHGPHKFEPNFARISMLTGKIGHSHYPTKEDMENYREMKERLERLKRPPQQKSTLPVTESQEYGWSWEDARRDDMLDRRLPKESCDETKFASRFFELQHVGPFQKGAGKQ